VSYETSTLATLFIGVGRGGAVALLDFHTWYKYSR